MPHPRIGYVGRIKGQLDMELLYGLARRHPEWSFVMVGPLVSLHRHTRWVDGLNNQPNVHFLGSKPVDQLAAYNQHLDVCIMCYEISDYTNFIYPMKLHEYLATGRPVVASPIRTLQDFGNVISLASGIDEWSAALKDALSPQANSLERVAGRRKVARAYDWDVLTQRVAMSFCEHLGPEYVNRLERGTRGDERA